MKPRMRDYVTPGYVGAVFGVNPEIIRIRCDKGEIQCERSDSGHRRIAISGVGQWLQPAYSIPV